MEVSLETYRGSLMAKRILNSGATEVTPFKSAISFMRCLRILESQWLESPVRLQDGADTVVEGSLVRHERLQGAHVHERIETKFAGGEAL